MKYFPDKPQNAVCHGNCKVGMIVKFQAAVDSNSQAELGQLLYESNICILHITSYFYEEVIYSNYSYILLYQKSNFVILLLLSKVIILCNLVTSYRVTLKVYL